MKPIVAERLQGYGARQMFNDLSSPLAYLQSRRSGRAREMVAPGPSDEQLQEMIGMAARTPDHGKLAPWRFVIVGRDQREQLATLLREAMAAANPPPTPAHLQKSDDFARQGEALIVLLSSPVENHKIPVSEQEMSGGAVAMNLLHAAHALGFVGSWLTGWAAYDPQVRDAFAARPNERIVGFFFFGSPGIPLSERPRPELSTIARRWNPTA